MKKKLYMGFAAAFGTLIMSANAFAAEINSVKYDMGAVCVNGTAVPGASVQIAVVKEDGQPNDPDSVFAIGQFTCPADGRFSFEFEIADEEERGLESPSRCVCYVTENGESRQSKSFEYATKSELESLIGRIKQAGKIAGEIDLEDNYIPFKVLGVMIDDYKTLGEGKADFVSKFDADNDLASMTAEKIVSSFNSDLGVAFINNKDSRGFDILDAEYDGVKYSDLSDNALKVWIDSYVFAKNGCANIDEVTAAYDEANALYIVNNSISANLCGNLEKLKVRLKLSLCDGYTVLCDSDNTAKGKITETLASLIKADKAKTLPDLYDKINAAVASYKNSQQGGGSGGSGNSGGSGGAGGIKNLGDAKNYNIPPEVIPGYTEDNIFSDVDASHWAFPYIKKMYKMGVISGYNNEFKPQDSVTRAEFIKMISEIGGFTDESKTCDFSDVKKSDWFYKYVASMQNMDVVKGSDGNFRPEENISRQDVAVILNRCAEYLKSNPETIREGIEFSDNDSISEYARGAVDTLYQTGVISGKENNRFAPTDNCTRAEAAAMIARAYEKNFFEVN